MSAGDVIKHILLVFTFNLERKMFVSIHRKSLSLFITTLCITHSIGVTSATEGHSQNNCGSLKQLISETQACYTNDVAVPCPESAQPGAIITKFCKSFYENGGVTKTTYICEDGEWFPVSKPCELECGISYSPNAWVTGIYDSNNEHICTGTIISPYHILTAAGCFGDGYNESNDKNNYTVVAGKIYRGIIATKNYQQVRKINKIVQHEDDRDDKESYINDLALLELDEPFDLSDEVLPACIDWKSKYEKFDFVNANEGVAAYLESTKESGAVIHILGDHNISYWERKDCLKNLSEEMRPSLKNDNFCALYSSEGVKVCMEDRGGGLLFESDAERYFIRGVLSSTLNLQDTCNTNTYGVYTTLSSYLTWLRGLMEKNKNFYMNFNTRNRGRGCFLPTHIEYGKFSRIRGGVYIEKKPVSHYTDIELKCAQTDNESANPTFSCFENEWRPSIEDVECRKLGSCPSIRYSISEQVSCNLNGHPVTCTKPENNTIATAECRTFYTSIQRRSVYKCENGKWNQTIVHCMPECGLEETNVTANQVISEKNYPWVVVIYTSKSHFACFGTIISPYHVLTVANQFTSTNGELMDVTDYVIVNNKREEDENIPAEDRFQIRKIKTIRIPPSYKGSYDNFNYDIALIELKEPFTLTAKIRPICIDWDSLYERFDLKEGNQGGTVEITGPYASYDYVKRANVTYLQRDNCLQSVKLEFRIYLTDDKLCVSWNGTRDAKIKGGGLFFKSDEAKYFLRGISGIRLPLESSYRFYTKISDYLSWLKFHLKENRNVHIEFKTEDLKNGCHLPEHVKYGKFSVSNAQPYIQNKLVANSTVIVLSCAKNRDRNLPLFFRCLNKEWSPPVKKNECSKPGTCQPLKISLSEKVICKLNRRRASCDEPENGTIAVVRCKPFYKFEGNIPTYKCLNEVWDPAFKPCNLECGIKRVATTTLSVGGKETIQSEYPWVVAIYQLDAYICGGSIISTNYVLSAAHCFTTDDGTVLNKDNYAVAAGKYYRDINIQELSLQKRKIKSLFIHDDYAGKLQNHRDDIALIRVNEEFKVSYEVQPSCVDWDTTYEDLDLKEGKMGVIAGWGYVRENGTLSDVLKKVIVPFRSREVCLGGLSEEYSQAYYTSDKICAGYRNNGTNICRGDSGGGLHFKSDNRRYFIRGIASITVKSEYGCDSNTYALYTKVSKYLLWIKEMIQAEGQ